MSVLAKLRWLLVVFIAIVLVPSSYAQFTIPQRSGASVGGGAPSPVVTFDAVYPSSSGGAAGSGIGATTTGTSSGGGALSGSVTWYHTIVGSVNLLLDVGCSLGADVGDTGFVLSATDNGVAMTSSGGVVHANGMTNGFVEMWHVIGAASGVHTIVVSVGGTLADGGSGENWQLLCGSISFTNATGVANYTSGSGSSSGPSIMVTSAVGHMVVDVVGTGSGVTSSNKTLQWINNFSGSSAAGNAAGSTASGASSVTMGYTVTSDWWAMIGLDITP